MKKIIIVLLGFSLISIPAQQKTHQVAAKETLYAIAKKYNTTVDELLKQNPSIKNYTLNIGDVLVIPTQKKKSAKKGSGKKNHEELGKIYLQPRQTIYSITKQYKISESELRNLNPDLDNHMKIGDAVILPLKNIEKYGDVSSKPIPQKEKKIENPTPNGRDTYTVEPKDTYYGITRKFGISTEKLFALNPDLKEKGLHPGNVIRIRENNSIPTQKTNETSIPTQNVEEYVIHKVQRGDTAFGIINKYNISYEQLSKLNGGLKNGIKEGMELKIKKYEKQYIKVDSDAFSIALMLPFGFDSNDNKYRNLATDFLIGAKLAAEINTAKGKKINLNVIDAENEISFKNNLSQINKTNTNVIVGPFFKSNILEVLNYVEDKKIPVVAPFAHTSDLYDYSNLILVETNNRFYAEKIVEEVKKVHSGQKIYIVGEENNEEVIFLKNKFKTLLTKTDIIITDSPNNIELEQNMMTGNKVPSILVLASAEHNIGNKFAKKLVDLGKQTDVVKAFSMYYHADFEKNINELSQTNLVYLMDRKINTNGDFEKEILRIFNKKYCKTPSKYMIIGFDIVNDILSRESKGDFIKQMDKTQIQLATKFEYIRTKKNGAFVNTGYRVVRLIP